jgi:hypothetical protein
MSSYALLGALSGFRYSAVERTLWFGPRIKTRPFQCFFSTASGFGTITLHNRSLAVRLIEGELPIDKLVLVEGETSRTLDWKITVRSNVVGTREI